MKIVKTTFKELEELGCQSVTDYCRLMMNQSVLFANASVEVYRGDMLCLTVSSVKEGAKIQPGITEWDKYDKRRNKGPVEPRTEV